MDLYIAFCYKKVMVFQQVNLYKEAYERSESLIKSILKKFYEIEKNHEKLVQIELDIAMNSGYWLNYMGIDMEN